MDTQISEVRNVLLGGWVTAKANIIAAGQNLLKGTVLSELKSAAEAAADAGNTGDGTVGSISVGPLVKKGIYQLICNGSGFNIISPEGEACGFAVADEAFTSRELNLTVTAGAAAFVAGDFFTITVSGTGKHKMVAADSADGTGTADQVLMLDVDALDADVPSKGWESGEFDAGLLIVAEGESIASYRDQMRVKSMIQIESVGGNY
jgi:hypothetical protein